MSEIVFPGLVSIAIFSFWLTNSILKRLKHEHGDLYSNIGSPSLLTNNTPSTMVAFQKFVMLRRFKEIDDSGLSIKCEVLFWLQLFWIPAIIVVVIFVGQNA